MIDTCIFDYRDFEYWHGDLDIEFDIMEEETFDWEDGEFVQIDKRLYVSDEPVNQGKHLFIKLYPLSPGGDFIIGIGDILRCIRPDIRFSLKPVVCEAVMRTDNQADLEVDGLFFENQDEEWDSYEVVVQCRKAKTTTEKSNTIAKITNLFNMLKFDEENGKAEFTSKKLNLSFTIIVNNRGVFHMYSGFQCWRFANIEKSDIDIKGFSEHWIENKDQLNNNYSLSELLNGD